MTEMCSLGQMCECADLIVSLTELPAISVMSLWGQRMGTYA